MTTPVQTRLMFRSPMPGLLGQVTGGGTLKDSRGVPPMRVFGRFALVYLLDGAGAYRDANGAYRDVTVGDAFLVFPDVPHSYGPGAGQFWHELHLVFEGPLFDLWRAAGLLNAARPVARLEPLPLWRARLEAFLAPPFPSTAAARVAEACRLLALLTEAFADGEDRPAWLATATSLLTGHLEDGISLPDVAGQVGMPYETFRRYFAREMGVSPARYRAAWRMDAARDLLRSTRLTGRQIAELLGFADEGAFCRRFKQETGQTPRQFRRS